MEDEEFQRLVKMLSAFENKMNSAMLEISEALDSISKAMQGINEEEEPEEEIVSDGTTYV